MSGHNKWSKIKHAKGATDAKRGKVFSKLSRELTVAARDGGGDPDMNARLRQAIATAKAQNMPGDTITRAVKKGTGELEGVIFEEACYEGYAPGGVAFLVELVTDNKNRAAADIRSIFKKNSGSLGTSGSVAFLFDRKGEIRVPAASIDEEAILEKALDAGAEDVQSDDDEHLVYTAADQLDHIAGLLRDTGVEITAQQLVRLPQTTINVPDSGTASQVLRLYEALDEYEDTQGVVSNFDISDEILLELSQR